VSSALCTLAVTAWSHTTSAHGKLLRSAQVYIDLFDRLDENLAAALQRDCDKWAKGIEIIAARVTKPRIP